MKTQQSLFFAALFTSVTACNSETPKKPLNIVHIMTDDHSFQTISAYGHPISKLAPTPNIDRLAAEGVLFRRAFVENSLSTPSRACLMTGLYSHQNGQRTLGKGIDTTKIFVSELLQARGYQTAVIGKWHMQCEPKGFDFFHVLHEQGHYYNPEFKSPDSGGKYIREDGYATSLITDHAVEFLETRDPDKPFCLFVHHKAPHRNWMPDVKYLNLYEDVEFPCPETFEDDYSTRCTAAASQEMTIAGDMTLLSDLKTTDPDNENLNIAWNDTVAAWSKKGLTRRKAYERLTPRQREALGWQQLVGRMTPEQQDAWTKAYSEKNRKFIAQNPQGKELTQWKYQRYLKDYLRCIKTVDDEVGRLVKYLEDHGLLENTIIVYTSDQGFYMGEHGWFDKRFMYEESFRTPLIIRYPGNTPRGIDCDALVQNIDFAPTFLDVAGAAKPEAMTGASLLPLSNGTAPAGWREYLYYHYYDYPAVHQVRRQDGVRDARYKLIHFYGKGFGKDKGNDINCNELYDLHNDPNELHNLYDRQELSEVRERLQKRLEQFRTDLKVDEY
ncbi:MAG: sulfatase [Bacteroidales bacterium]|jgi:arylsulfatase A-like enzyme|nr:sulfatase [Bacteroidales bacterium]